jgi:predicted metalloprotease with PDZ domain
MGAQRSDDMKRIPGTILHAGALVVLAVLTAGPARAQHDHDPEHTVFVHEAGDDDTAYLGVSVVEETDNPEGGARITAVMDDSPAVTAGLEAGDIVVGFNGEPVRGPRSLTEKIHEASPGDSVELEVLRDGRRETLFAELGERPQQFSFSFGDVAPDFRFEFDEEELGERMEELQEKLKDLDIQIPHLSGQLWRVARSRPKLGVQLVNTTPELRVHLGATEDAGVLVGKVIEGMPAESAGIEVGDLIIAVDGDDIESAGDLIHALMDKDGQIITVDVVRERSIRSFQVAIPEVEEDDEVTGPRASAHGTDALREAERAYREASRSYQGEVRRAIEQARRAYHQALREARDAQREALDEARRAREEAIRESRSAARAAGSV